MKIACVRADSGFPDDELLTFLEEEMLPYIVVARPTAAVRRNCAGLKEWTALDETFAVGEIGIQLRGWTTQRRFLVLRERVREGKSVVGRVLLDMPGYTYCIFVTNRSESTEIIWRD